MRVLGDWPWETRPTAVMSMPSRSHSLLLESVARGLFEAGRLPYLGALTYASPPQGGRGGNRAFLLAQVVDAFEVPGEVEGTILLVDDRADSRRTLTVASRLLRQVGADGLLPFAVALRG